MNRPAHWPVETVRFTGARGIGLAADICGDPAAPPVLLLHGGGQTRHAWGGAAAALAQQGFRAISLDLRGHGESDWAPDGWYDLDAFVADLRSVMSVLPTPAAVVGASLGGITALLALGEAGAQTAKSLVLVDVTPRIENAGADEIRAFMRARPNGFGTLEEVADSIAAFLPHRPRPADLSGLQRNLRTGDDGRFYWHWDPAFVFGDRRSTARSETDRLERAAAALRLPTLLVRGGLSRVVSEDGVNAFRALVPHAEFLNIADADHMVAGDRNDAFNTAVLDFLARHAMQSGHDPGGNGPSRLHEAFDLRRHVRRARQTGRGARNGLPAVAQVAKALPRNALITFKTRSIVFMTSSQVI